MQMILLLLTLFIVINRSIANKIVLADFQQQALVQHNYYRLLHCTPPLELNSTLNNLSQSYAEYLATNHLFQDSHTPGVAENLWIKYLASGIRYVNGSSPTDSWYKEIAYYSYSSPGFVPAAGHFTQLIWDRSTQLGIGIGFTSNNDSAYVVAMYHPPGNVVGEFAQNVLPLCSATSVGTTMTTTKKATNPKTTKTTKTTTPKTTKTTTPKTTKTTTPKTTKTTTPKTTKTTTPKTTKTTTPKTTKTTTPKTTKTTTPKKTKTTTPKTTKTTTPKTTTPKTTKTTTPKKTTTK